MELNIKGNTEMTKLLIIPSLLALTLFALYNNKVEEESIYIYPVEIKENRKKILSEQVEIFTIKNEAIIKDISKDEKPFTVETTLELNTTRDNETTLTAIVKNSKSYNLFWYEKGELIGMGETITHSFTKGEHTIYLQAKDTKGHESNATIMLKAWDYRKVKTLYFDTNSDEFKKRNIRVYDHKNRLILRDGIYSKYSVIFNENGQKEEIRNEYYQYPEWNKIEQFTYTEKGDIKSVRTVNLNDELIRFVENIYDEKGNLTNIISGIVEDELTNYTIYQEEEDESEDEVYSKSEETVYEEINDNKSKIVYNEHNQTTYEEITLNDIKEVSIYEYDNKQNMIRSKITSTYQNYENIVTLHYDKDMNELNREEIYINSEEVTCHFNSSFTYNKAGQKLINKNEVLDGNCENQYISNSFTSYTYDKDGELKQIVKADEEGSDELYVSYKILKFYTNSLEEE